MQSDCLQSDSIQFAYKENASTVQCASVICEVINYTINNDSCIYMCMLDASKAFDRVNHLSLFNKFKLRYMCPTILNFLMCTYQRQSVMVNWNGGVLSPVLFTVYLDDLIDQLRKKGLGCHFNSNFLGCFIYADITLLAPSRDALNTMLDVCMEYAEAYDILFNATKTKCMFFDRTYSTLFDKNVQFMGTPIGFVDKCKFFGFSISRDILNRDIQSCYLEITIQNTLQPFVWYKRHTSN